jgi:hypothetical protein
MAGIVSPMRDILTQLNTLYFTRVWNNQLTKILSGELEYQILPAVYLEVVSPSQYNLLGIGYTTSDINFKIHIIHEFYDAQDGTFEQDLLVFDIRDQIIALLSGFRPSFCGVMFKVAEEQDFEHTNLYHYIVDFTANYIDDSGSPNRPGSDTFTPSIPPLELEVDVTIEKNGDVQPSEHNIFIVNKQ